MVILLVTLHVISCIILIIGILMQSGKGGGLSGTFGGDMAQNILGTNASNFLTKATVVSAIVFLCTCIGLTIVTTQRSKSLVERLPYRGNVPVNIPAIPAGAVDKQSETVKEQPKTTDVTEGEKGALDKSAENSKVTPDEPETELPETAQKNNQNQ